MIKNKKIVVTGGAGFIGSHLCEVLVADNEVIAFDDFSTGKEENLIEGVEIVKGSITDLELMKSVFIDVDIVFHQAAIPSVPRSIENPLPTNNANITGTLNVLLASRDNRVPKVMYASSSSVYGDSPTLPKIEDMPINPKSPYAITKLAGEQYCKVFNEIYGLPTVALRYFNVFGPKQSDNQYSGVISIFISAALKNQPLIIFGDGEQTRDFTYCKDVVNANLLAAQSKSADGGVFNVAGGRQITINEIAKMIIELTGSRSKIIHAEKRSGDIEHSLADISKAKNTFGYNPKYAINEGLKKIIEEGLI